MNIIRIIRDIEISKVLNEPLVGEAKELMDWFDDLFSKMEYETLEKCPDSIFFTIGKKYYFEQDNKNDMFWCRYKSLWSVFETKYGYNNQETRDLIKYLVEEQLNKKVSTPDLKISKSINQVEEQLNKKVSTPQMQLPSNPRQVVLNKKVSTPKTASLISSCWVEEQLNKTPEIFHGIYK